MSTIDVSADSLATIVPMLAATCRIVGSEEGPARTVRLRIEGPAIPEGHVTALVTRTDTEEGVTLKTVFSPA